ncbi:MAG: LON peptidase substrate-binding domain-containing protein [Phycisphaerae bacterium]|nr:LON peptidase substrate-binding domain-containing protein [Phycisphaerae bacterium]
MIKKVLPHWIPIFPLPNAVLLPRTILPLHIYEPRYREMTEDVLSGRRFMAIALLKPGYEAAYHTLDAKVCEIVGVGRVLRDERLPDGRFNLLLQGHYRTRIIEERKDRVYRQGRLEVIEPIAPQPEQECAVRRRLRELLNSSSLASWAKEANWNELFACSAYSLSDVVDVIASSLVKRPEDRQCFLEELCVERRARCICSALTVLSEQLAQAAATRRARPWPPTDSCN